MSLPKGFKRLEYIQSSGTQYVDTLFKPKWNTRVVMDVQMATYSAIRMPFGYRNANSTTASQAFLVAQTGMGTFRTDYFGTSASLTIDGTTNQRLTIDKDANVLTINGKSVSNTAVSSGESSYNMLLFTYSNSGSAGSMSTMTLYSCQIYDNGTLVRDYIPCQNASGVIGLWDAVNEVFYGNAGTGTFTAGPVVPEIVDENEITELEYIQSSGVQYLDTGFIPNQNTRLVLDGYNDLSSSGWIYGTWESATSKQFAGSCNKSYAVRYGSTNATLTENVPVGSVHFDQNRNTYDVNGTTGSFTEQTFTCQHSIFLFAINAAGVVSSGKFTGKIYSCQIYNNGLLERDYIPAMLSNGEVGLYDRVFHGFYRNAGTGEFTAGQEMVHDSYTELEYIESDGTQYIDTGLAPNQDTRVVMDLKVSDSHSGEGHLCSARSTTSGPFWILYYNNSKYTTRYGRQSGTAFTTSDRNRHIFDKNKNVTSIDDETIQQNYETFAVSANLPLLCRLTGTTTDGFLSAKLYACQVYDNSESLRIYIPVLHPSGVAGLWDSVNERFYASATTTGFLVGPEASKTPNAPSTFQLDSVSDTSIVVSWQNVADALGYKLWLNSSLIAETTETTATVTVEPFARMVLSLVAYNENGNSPVVTLTHQYAPDNPVLWLVTDRTLQDVSLGNTKGTYNAVDLNRVGYAVEYLVHRLAECGVAVTVHPKTDWVTTDIPSEQVLTTYLQNVRTLRTALTLVASVPEVPQDMQFFTHTEANSIEMLLVMLDTHITKMLSIVDTSWTVGSTYTGLYAKEAYT